MRDIYVVGDANVDIIVPYPRFLNEERTLVDYPNPELVGGGRCRRTVQMCGTSFRKASDQKKSFYRLCGGHDGVVCLL